MKGRGNASETRKKGPNCSKNRQAHQKWRDGAGCSGEYFSSLLGLGRLPGDFQITLFGKTIWLPIATTVVLSLLAGLIARYL